VILVTHDLREALYLADTVYLMGGKPGQMLERRTNDLARPRTLDDTYSPDFTGQVQHLRKRIGEVRERMLEETL
jgi:NitT/TauT family transport system ATP-binding protein